MIRRALDPFAGLFAVLGVASACACARPSAPDALSSTAPSGSASAAPAPSGSTAAMAAADASVASIASSSSIGGAPVPDVLPPGGVDFIEQARVLFRVAACGPTGEIPPRFDAAVVGKHCSELEQAYDEYRKSWVDLAKPFLANLRPRDLPNVVVYPFGGGDVVTALATFPDAKEITTISLEPAGDIRPVDTMAPGALAHELGVHRSHLERLFEKAHSRTDNLDKEAHTDMPGEIVFDLAALVVHGDEPVSLRYFRLQPDGTPAYVTQGDIDAQAHHPAALKALFQNAELRFRASGAAAGVGAGGGGGGNDVRVIRHIAFNLDDAHLKADPSLIAHLTTKGKVAAMTKAASHLLWNEHFSTIRGWLIDHTDWMISDSTGIPPRFAQPAGFVQDTYGTFDGPALFGLYDKRDADDMKRLFKAEPSRELAFRYGYPDQDGHAHLLVTRRDESGHAGAPEGGPQPPPAGSDPKK